MELENLEETQETPLEYQVFALSFREPGAISYFAEHLRPDIVGSIHGDQGIHEFYVALLDFYKETKLEIVEPVAFRTYLQEQTEIYDVLGGAGGVQFFIDTLSHIELAKPDSVTKMLRWKANRRLQMNHLQTLQTLIAQKGHKSEEDIEKIAELTEKIRLLQGDLGANPLEKVRTALDIIDSADDLMTVPDFLPTPFKAYNKALGYDEDKGGYYRGACHAIVALSGQGKSTLSKSLSNFWLDQGYRVLYINFEEAKTHWERILMSQVLKENVYASAGNWTEAERKEKMKTFAKRLESWGDRLMVRHDPESLFFEDLEIWLYDIIGHGGQMPDVVVIDTIQSMITKRSHGARHSEFESMMIRLEKIAKQMNAAFVITSQQNNESLREKREVLDQRDVGSSVTIVQKCSIITFITSRKSITGNDAEQDEIMQLQIVKNRITGGAFKYDPPLVIYRDESKDYEEFDIVNIDEYDMNKEAAEEIFGFEDFFA